MTYDTMGKIASSMVLRKRINACAAQEGVTGNVEVWSMNHIWQLAAQPGWTDAWEYCENTMIVNNNPDIGARDDVVNDGMILAAVQPMVQAEQSAP